MTHFSNLYQLTFSDGAHIAYTEQDFDVDGVRTFFDTHQTGDNDGDGTVDSEDDYPNNPARWADCDDGHCGRLACIDASAGHSASGITLVPDRVPARNISNHSLVKLPALMHPLVIM